MVTTQELVKRCLSRQFHLESWGGDPGPRPGPELSPMPLLSLHWGEWIYPQALAGSEDCPLGGDMFTITAPKRGILLKKAENKKTNKKKPPKTQAYLPFCLQGRDSYSILAAGVRSQLSLYWTLFSVQ